MDIVGKPDGAFKGESLKKGKHKPVLEAPLIMEITRKDAGSTKHGPLSFTKEVDDSSPSLWQAHTSNEVLPELSFMVYKPGGDVSATDDWNAQGQ
jgi:type VI secretion system Hcp family effector